MLVAILSTTFGVNAFAYSVPYSVSIGVDFDRAGIDTSNDAELFSSDMEDIGFEPIFIDDLRYADWDDVWGDDDIYLLEADVIMLAGHGNADGVYFNYLDRGGRFATGVCSGNSQYVDFNGEEYHLAGLNEYDNEDTVLAAFVACNTAKGSYSLTELANLNGINYTLGWKETIQDGDAELWLDYFGRYLAEDYNITDAIAKANSRSVYEDEDTITATQGYVEDVEALNMVLRDYVDEYEGYRASSIEADSSGSEASRTSSTDNDDSIDIVVEEDIVYRNESDLDNIYEYITENFDENFDSNKFKIKTDINNITLNNENVYTAVSLRLKYGDFVSENGYYVTILNDKLDKIFIEGDPKVSNLGVAEYSMNITDVDEDVLKNMAIEEIDLEDSEEIINQRVLKKFDTEPYYVVITEINDVNSDISRGESFEYRI